MGRMESGDKLFSYDTFKNNCPTENDNPLVGQDSRIARGMVGRSRNNIKISKNFYLYEFECKHCGKVMIDYHLLNALQYLRDTIQSPILIYSGYRCETWNREVGGKDKSFHLKGMASDIFPKDFPIRKLYEIILADTKLFAIHYPEKEFIHVDTRYYP